MPSNRSVALWLAAVAALVGCGPGQGTSGDGSAEGGEQEGTLGGSASTADVPTGADASGSGASASASGSGDSASASGSGDSASASEAPDPDGPPDAGGTTDAEDPPGGGDTTDAGETTNDEPAEPPAACVGIDHQNCFPAVLDACVGEGNWDVSEQCVAAVTACYPMGTASLAAADIVQFCSAEISGDCLFFGGPGCGETFCACTVGAFPFDWDNCWHLTLVACRPEVASDCDTVLAGCYPGTTESDYETCKQQVMNSVGHECDCAMCSIHEECEVALDACMGA